jgi:hypothetical protein
LPNAVFQSFKNRQKSTKKARNLLLLANFKYDMGELIKRHPEKKYKNKKETVST